MKHIVKIITFLVAISAFWIGLLQTSILPPSYAWLVSVYHHSVDFYFIYSTCFPFQIKAYTALFHFSSQLPIYFIVSLGCYGLLMVGVGLMRFPTCPQEAILLQQVFNLLQFSLKSFV